MSRRKKNTASEWRGPFEIQLLPPDIIIDILSWLPVKTILCCKSVCKDWHRLISHPRFVELQLARSSPAILVKTITCKISFTHVEQSGRAHYRLYRLAPPKSNLPSPRFRLVNSCNGLLCLSGNEKQGPIWVCNPILGEYVTIPSASKGRDWGSFIALGFCSVANRYKLLQTFNPKVKGSGNYFPDAEIYDMDTGTWRSIGRAPCGSVILPFNSLLRGSLHWIRSSGVGAEYIYSFNFEKEEFGWVPPPPCLDLHETQRQSFNKVTLRLGVVECCLFLCVIKRDSHLFDIWVMKDYGVKESWTKQFVIENTGYPEDIYEPIKFLNNGEILMWYNCWEVVCCDTRINSFRGTSITRTHHHHESTAHTPSLVSLYHVTKGELVKSTLGQYAKIPSQGLSGIQILSQGPQIPSQGDGTSRIAQTQKVANNPNKGKRRQSGGAARLSSQIDTLISNSNMALEIMKLDGSVSNHNNATFTIDTALSHINRMVTEGHLEDGSELWCYAISLIENEVRREIFLKLENDASRKTWLMYMHAKEK